MVWGTFFSCSMWALWLLHVNSWCGMWALVPWPEIHPGPPALGAWNLSHWTTDWLGLLAGLSGVFSSITVLEFKERCDVVKTLSIPIIHNFFVNKCSQHIFKRRKKRIKCMTNSFSLRVQPLSHIWLFATPWTVAHQAPLSMEFSRQEYWSRLPLPFSGDLPNPEIKCISPALAGSFFTTALPGKLGNKLLVH